MGKHAAPGYGRFTRELWSFSARLLVVAVLFFGAIWAVVTFVPDLIAGDDGDVVAQTEDTDDPDATSTTASDTSVLQSTVSSVAQPVTTTTTLAPTTTTTVPPERAPADVVVLVLNSTSTSGLAATATAALDALGYQTLEPDNWSTTLSGSQILFAPTFAAEAYTLAAAFPDGDVLANPSSDPSADIVVILGTAYVP
mgnify:CR=1 FL=1